MFGTPFAHDELTKYMAIFGTLFNNIVITRDDATGKKLQSFKVPVAYGPREKFLTRNEADPELNRPYAELLPRIAYELVDFEYDSERKKTSTARWTAIKTRNGKKISYDQMWMPVPYNLKFEMTILANRLLDATRILGSIVPFFRPDFSVTVEIIPELPDYKIDVPVILNGIQPTDEYEGDFTKRRIIEYKLTFTMKAELFGPVTEAKVIKVAKVNMYGEHDQVYDTIPTERYIVQPGLTADGQPTTDPAQSISPLLIEETDDWGYVCIVENGPIYD
jgi:hypothetical protein